LGIANVFCAIIHNPYASKKILLSLVKIYAMSYKQLYKDPSTNNYVDGLYIKNGRLINDRPDGESGIARAASVKRSIRNDRKINQIAEGIELADNKKNFNQLEF
jgi:hypothetical protein|tara:strand:- start:31 stop:342 length:312 start_codon:yes stop_codon:yes gene_type:complete